MNNMFEVVIDMEAFQTYLTSTTPGSPTQKISPRSPPKQAAKTKTANSTPKKSITLYQQSNNSQNQGGANT